MFGFFLFVCLFFVFCYLGKPALAQICVLLEKDNIEDTVNAILPFTVSHALQ